MMDARVAFLESRCPETRHGRNANCVRSRPAPGGFFEKGGEFAGTCLALQSGMVGARSAVACARIKGTVDARLGRYQPLVVAVITALLLALVSVPKVTLPLR